MWNKLLKFHFKGFFPNLNKDLNDFLSIFLLEGVRCEFRGFLGAYGFLKNSSTRTRGVLGTQLFTPLEHNNVEAFEAKKKEFKKT